MDGCFSKLALSAVQGCTQSRASLHAAFSKFAQRPVQACAATLPNLRSTDSKLALGVGHGGKEKWAFRDKKKASFLVYFEFLIHPLALAAVFHTAYPTVMPP